MKVGIVTFFYGNNYGGVLQSYALQKYLADNAIESEFINYIPPSNSKKSFFNFAKTIVKKIIKKGRNYNLHNSDLEQFNDIFTNFVKNNLVVSNKYYHLNQIKTEDYDTLIASSDQIWNTKLNKDFMPYFLLEFCGLKTKKISYASCIGQPEQIKEFEKYFEIALPKFSHMSVRNHFSKKYIQDMSKIKNVSVACDPTLLINFDSFLSPYSLPFKEYILVYSLNLSLETLLNETISKVKTIYDLPLVVINSKFFIAIHKEHFRINDATPMQWIGLFKNASFVITDSFHGVVFSLKYKRNFIALHGNDWRSHRIEDLSKNYGFEDRCICENQSIDILNSEVDYELIDKKIDEHVEFSKKYLLEALK